MSSSLSFVFFFLANCEIMVKKGRENRELLPLLETWFERKCDALIIFALIHFKVGNAEVLNWSFFNNPNKAVNQYLHLGAIASQQWAYCF